MTDIAPREVKYAVTDDPSWLGSAHGLNATRSITLDISKFEKDTHYPDGVIPSGVAVAKDSATGKYVPASDAEDAEQLDEIVFTFGARRVTAPDANILVAGLDHGRVVEARLPVPITADIKTAVGARIQFV